MSILVKIADLDLSDKTVLIREDYNVPVKDGQVVNDTRIRATLPTLQQVLAAGAKIILVSHLGRPTPGEYDAALSLAPVAESLGDFLGLEVPLVKNWTDGIDLTGHRVVLCENVRFEKGETENDDELARKMAQLCQVYINDAFASAHRAQASTYGVAKYAGIAAAGPLLINELKALTRAFREPRRPVLAVVGGSKVSTKLTILQTLVEKVDRLIVGGGIANTFLKAGGHEIGQSLFEPELVDAAGGLMKKAEAAGCFIPLPSDVACAKVFSDTATAEIKAVEALEPDDMILDVGPQTTISFDKVINDANTVIWNGPLGVFEFDRFSRGSRALANAIADSDAYSIAGGGDTIAAISKFGVTDKISYISTGGGAFLEFIEGKKLPAIAILEEAARAWAAMEKAREL